MKRMVELVRKGDPEEACFVYNDYLYRNGKIDDFIKWVLASPELTEEEKKNSWHALAAKEQRAEQRNYECNLS